MRSIVSYSYGCLLARFGEPLAGAIRSWGSTIPDDRIFNNEEGDMGREDKPHVTVKYGLHTSDVDEVMSKLSGWPPFQVTLGRTSVFHNEDCIVLKLGVEGRDLINLNRYVSKVFEVTDTHPTYNPHATIAYLVKDDEDPYYYQEYFTDNFEGMIVDIDELEFSTASGDKFTIPLEGTDMNMQAMQLLGMARDIIGENNAI